MRRVRTVAHNKGSVDKPPHPPPTPGCISQGVYTPPLNVLSKGPGPVRKRSSWVAGVFAQGVGPGLLLNMPAAVAAALLVVATLLAAAPASDLTAVSPAHTQAFRTLFVGSKAAVLPLLGVEVEVAPDHGAATTTRATANHNYLAVPVELEVDAPQPAASLLAALTAVNQTSLRAWVWVVRCGMDGAPTGNLHEAHTALWMAKFVGLSVPVLALCTSTSTSINTAKGCHALPH